MSSENYDDSTAGQSAGVDTELPPPGDSSEQAAGENVGLPSPISPSLSRVTESQDGESDTVPTIYMPTMDLLDDPLPIPFPPTDLPPEPAEHSGAPTAMDYYEEAMGGVSLPSDPHSIEKFATLRLRDPEMLFEDMTREWWKFRRHEDEFVKGHAERVPRKHTRYVLQAHLLLTDEKTPWGEVKRRWRMYLEDAQRRENGGVPAERFWWENRATPQ